MLGNKTGIDKSQTTKDSVVYTKEFGLDPQK